MRTPFEVNRIERFTLHMSLKRLFIHLEADLRVKSQGQLVTVQAQWSQDKIPQDIDNKTGKIYSSRLIKILVKNNLEVTVIEKVCFQLSERAYEKCSKSFHD